MIDDEAQLKFVRQQQRRREGAAERLLRFILQKVESGRPVTIEVSVRWHDSNNMAIGFGDSWEIEEFLPEVPR